jgi:hypothetical protein
MLATVVVCFAILLLFSFALAIGQFFGRDPITPKCNPGPCCLQGDNCERRSAATQRRH